MLHVAVGHSEDVLVAEAVREVVAQIRRELGSAAPQAGVLFCSIDLDHAEVLGLIAREFPNMELIGCTTDGETSSCLGFAEDSLVLMAFASDSAEIRSGVGRNVPTAGELAGREAALMARGKLAAQAGREVFALILADPMSAGISQVDKGVQSVLGRSFPVAGGVAAAHSKMRRTFQFHNGEVLSQSVVLLLFAGPLAFSTGIKGGHSPLAPRLKVTASAGNVLQRIGESSALEYFQKYTGKADLFMNFCLAVYERGRETCYVLSAPSSDAACGSVTLNGPVPPDGMVQLGTADKETLMKSCKESLRLALDAYPEGLKPSGALVFSCAGRKMMLGTRVVDETALVRDALGQLPFAGFYCYGEFGPLQKGDPFLFHGTTFVTLLFGSAESKRARDSALMRAQFGTARSEPPARFAD